MKTQICYDLLQKSKLPVPKLTPPIHLWTPVPHIAISTQPLHNSLAYHYSMLDRCQSLPSEPNTPLKTGIKFGWKDKYEVSKGITPISQVGTLYLTSREPMTSSSAKTGTQKHVIWWTRTIFCICWMPTGHF